MKYIWNIRNDLICSAILIKHFTRYSTACSCAPYCEVELLRPVAHIWSRKPCIWSCTWRVLNFHSCEYSSEFCFKVLGWGNTNLNLLIQAADVIHVRWNYWHFLLLFDSEWVHGKTSNSHFTFIDISERYMFNWRLKHHKGQTVLSKIHMISLHARCNIALLWTYAKVK